MADPQIGTAAYGDVAGNKKPPKLPAQGSEQDLVNRAAAIEKEERARYEGGLGVATDAYNESRQTLSETLDADLLYSRAADSVGARSKAGVESIRSSLGARGLNSNSGAAGGLMQRLLMSAEGQRVGAKRDIGLENQNVRHRNAAINFANALNLGQLQNAPVSAVGLDTATNIFEGNLAREGIASAERSSNYAAKKNKQGAVGGGALGLAGGAIGGK